MKKLILFALVILLASCDKESQDAIDNTPDTEAQVIYSVKFLNSTGASTVLSDNTKLVWKINSGGSKTVNLTNSILSSGGAYSYPETFTLNAAKKTELIVESNLFVKGWSIEAEITRVTKAGMITSLKKQTLTANGTLTANVD